MLFKKVSSFNLLCEDVDSLIAMILEKADDFVFMEDAAESRSLLVGWQNFVNTTDKKIVEVGDFAFMNLKISTKKVKPKIIAQAMEQHIDKLATENGGVRPDLTKKQKAEIKEKITEELVLQAIPEYSNSYLAIDKNKKRIYVDSHGKTCDHVLNHLRATLGGTGLKVIPTMRGLEMSRIGQWIMGTLDTPKSVSFGSDFALGFDQSKVTYKNIDSGDDALVSHLSEGYKLTQVQLILNDALKLKLNHKGEIADCGISGIANEQYDNFIHELPDSEDLDENGVPMSVKELFKFNMNLTSSAVDSIENTALSQVDLESEEAGTFTGE